MPARRRSRFEHEHEDFNAKAQRREGANEAPPNFHLSPFNLQLSVTSQPQLFPEGITEVEVAELRAWLLTHGWQTRRQLMEGLGWSERKIREVAEGMGADVVRCQSGFKLMETLTREELGLAVQARDAFRSQGRKNLRYSLQLGRRIHAFLG